jgi:hypothetical protein
MSDGGGMFADLRQRIFSAVMLLLLVALGARIAADLLEPLVPVLVALVLLGVIGWVLLGRRK